MITIFIECPVCSHNNLVVLTATNKDCGYVCNGCGSSLKVCLSNTVVVQRNDNNAIEALATVGDDVIDSMFAAFREAIDEVLLPDEESPVEAQIKELKAKIKHHEARQEFERCEALLARLKQLENGEE